MKNKNGGSRKKVGAEKSSNRRKSRTFFRSNFFPPIFFEFIWNRMSYNSGRPLILKLVPNNEEWNDEIAWFSLNSQRKFILKWNVTVHKIEFYVKINQSIKISWDLGVPSSAGAAVKLFSSKCFGFIWTRGATTMADHSF